MTLTARDKVLRGRVALGHGRARHRHLAGGRPLLLPGLLDGAQQFQDGAGTPTPSPCSFFEPTLDRWQSVTEAIPGLLSFGEAFYNSFLVVIVSTLVVLAAGHPGRVLALHLPHQELA